MTGIERERESFARIPAASTRRLFLKAGSAAAVFGSLTAACSPSPALASDPRDPVLVALEEFKAASNNLHAVADPHDDEAVDAAADRVAEARSAVLNAVPTTRTGAEWLALFTASEAGKVDSDLAQGVDTLTAFMLAAGAQS